MYIEIRIIMDYATGMLALCAGLLNLTVASVISLTGPPSGDSPLLRAHPRLLVLSATSAQV